MRKFALGLVISTVLCIFVTDVNAQTTPQNVPPQEFEIETTYPDTIATIWIIQTSSTNQRTLCKTAYDLRLIMEIVGSFFQTILEQPCQEPEKPARPATKIKRI